MAHQPFGHAPRSGSVANRTIRILGVLCLNQYQGGIYAVTLGRLLRPPRRTFLRGPWLRGHFRTLCNSTRTSGVPSRLRRSALADRPCRRNCSASSVFTASSRRVPCGPFVFRRIAMGPYYIEEVVSHRKWGDRSRSFTSLSLWVVATAGPGIPSVLNRILRGSVSRNSR